MIPAMKKIYLSTYGVAFSDYALMKKFVTEFPDFGLGIEYATSWKNPDFHEKLQAAVTDLVGIPATIHSPFMEICTDPGSEAEARMTAAFDKACDYYDAFRATSMVFHTHEGVFAESEKADRRKRTRDVLLHWYDKLTKRGIRMTVENVGYPKKGNVLFDYENFVRLFEELPEGIGCLIDTGHAFLNAWDVPALIEEMGERIRGYHLNNNDGWGDLHYPCFDPEGVCKAPEMDRLLRAIAKYSPKADLCLEYAPSGRFTQESLYEDIRRIVRVTEEAGA